MSAVVCQRMFSIQKFVSPPPALCSDFVDGVVDMLWCGSCQFVRALPYLPSFIFNGVCRTLMHWGKGLCCGKMYPVCLGGFVHEFVELFGAIELTPCFFLMSFDVLIADSEREGGSDTVDCRCEIKVIVPRVWLVFLV